MKLKDGFITHMSDGEQIMVAVGDEAAQFHGLVRSNKTAAFIIDCLKQECTKEQIVEAAWETFDVSYEVVSSDVDKVIVNLRKIGAIS